MKIISSTMMLGFILAINISTQAASVDLAHIFDLAVENDPQVSAAEAVFLSRSEVVNQTRAGILPNINVSSSFSDTTRTYPNTNIPDYPYDTTAWQATLSQPLFRLDRWYRFKQSKNIKAQAQALFTAEQQALIVRVAESYLNILEAQDGLESAKAERNAVKRQLEQVQQRFDVGLVAITDVLESTAAFDSSTVNVIESEGVQASSFEPLVRLTGRKFTSISALNENFPVKYPDPMDEQQWVEAALIKNTSVLATQAAVKIAEKQIQISKSNYLPTLDAQLLWQSQETGNNFSAGSETEQQAMAFSLNIPVFSGGATRSAVKQSRFDLQEAHSNLDLTQRQIAENTRELFIAITTDVARVRARLRGIESSRSALEAVQTGYEVGTRNIVDVLLAQQRLFLSEFQFASAKYRYINDTLRLKQMVGTLSPEDIYELNAFIDVNQQVEQVLPTTR
jgi:outer membrane protein